MPVRKTIFAALTLGICLVGTGCNMQDDAPQEERNPTTNPGPGTPAPFKGHESAATIRMGNVYHTFNYKYYVPNNGEVHPAPEACGGMHDFRLSNEENKTKLGTRPLGKVKIGNDFNNLYLTFELGDYLANKVNILFGDSAAATTVTATNLANTTFTIKTNLPQPKQTISYEIPLSNLPEDFYICIHIKAQKVDFFNRPTGPAIDLFMEAIQSKSRATRYIMHCCHPIHDKNIKRKK